jgi:SagB-type dehydrogenase family enzyme
MSVLEREDRAAPDWPWTDWMPEAAFFHFGTRDAEYPVDLFEHELPLVEKAKTTPQPPPTKTSSGSRTRLPAAADMGELGRTLKSRRTWRQISDEPIEVGALANLLGLTWGVQRRGHVRGQGDVVFKTSPSGGSRHPVEAYVIALSVSGLAPAVYHYDASTHELVKVAARITPAKLVKVLGNQFYFRNCAAALVMTACFERTMWRYPFTRAYRSVLIEAGHLGQTFCLLATAMELAPFTTIAYKDRELESLIGVDGVAESAMYVVGVGNRKLDALDHPGRIHPRKR